MRKNQRKSKQTKNLRQPLDSIGELDDIDIFAALDAIDIKDTKIIHKLEQLVPEYKDILMKNFLVFYMKVCGLEEFVPNIEEVQDKTKNEEILGQIIQQAEQQQIKNPNRELIQESTAKKILGKNGLSKNCKEFFTILFSDQTDFVFKTPGFFDTQIHWFQDLMRSRIRVVRVACIELIEIITHCVLERAKALNKDNQINKSLLYQKFIELIKQNIFFYTIKDIYSPIQKKTCQILFNYLRYLPSDFENHAFLDTLGYIFIHEKYECREEAIKSFNLLLDDCQNQQENKELHDATYHLIQTQQEKILSLVFDQNQSIQSSIIKSIQRIPQIFGSNIKDLIKQNNIEAMTRILYRTDERIKYELLSCLVRISEEFRFCVQQQDPSSVVSLVKIFLKYMPPGQMTHVSMNKFLSPFFTIHKGLFNSENFINLMLKYENEQKVDEYEKIEFMEALIFLYAGCIQYSRHFIKNSTSYWWLPHEEDFLIEASRIPFDFSDNFLRNLKFLQLQFMKDDRCLSAYLELLQVIELNILQQPDGLELLDHILKQLQRLFDKQSNKNIIENSLKLMKCLNNLNQPLIRETIKSIIHALHNFIKSEGLTELNVHRILYLLQNSHALISELLKEEQVQELRNRIQGRKDDSFIALKVLGFGLIAAFKTILKKELKTFQHDGKGIQDFFDEFDLIKGLFFDEAFVYLKEKTDEQLNTYSLILDVLSYTNNNKLSNSKTINYQLTQQNFQCLYDVISEKVLKQLQSQNQNQIQDENQSIDNLNIGNLNTKLYQLKDYEIKAFTETIEIFKFSWKIVDQYYGVPVLYFLIQQSLSIRQSEQNNNYVLNIINDLFSFWFDVEFLDQNKNTLVYWKVVIEIVTFLAKQKIKTVKFYQDFARFIIENYISRNSNKKVTINQKREKFVSFCAELIYHSFQNPNEIESLHFLSNLIYRNSKLITKLNIDKVLLKKICAFFETKKFELIQRQNLGESEQKGLEKSLNVVQQNLREISGISADDLQRVAHNKDAQGSGDKNVSDNDQTDIKDISNTQNGQKGLQDINNPEEDIEIHLDHSNQEKIETILKNSENKNVEEYLKGEEISENQDLVFKKKYKKRR